MIHLKKGGFKGLTLPNASPVSEKVGA